MRPPIQRVSLPELRELFNTKVLPKIRSGEMLEIVRSQNQPNSRSGQPPGTLSQRVEYWTTVEGRLVKIATAHRYLRPDGSLGGSGLPDPKRVLHNGVVYAPHLTPPAPE